MLRWNTLIPPVRPTLVYNIYPQRGGKLGVDSSDGNESGTTTTTDDRGYEVDKLNLVVDCAYALACWMTDWLTDWLDGWWGRRRSGSVEEVAFSSISLPHFQCKFPSSLDPAGASSLLISSHSVSQPASPLTNRPVSHFSTIYHLCQIILIFLYRALLWWVIINCANDAPPSSSSVSHCRQVWVVDVYLHVSSIKELTRRIGEDF